MSLKELTDEADNLMATLPQFSAVSFSQLVDDNIIQDILLDFLLNKL